MKQNKYNAKRITCEHGTFDSKKEFKRFLDLREKERRGEITDLRRQVPFELIPKTRLPRPYINGKRMKYSEQAVKYFADFTYYRDGEFIVEDVKSKATAHKDSYILKKKLMLYRYGIQIMEV